MAYIAKVSAPAHHFAFLCDGKTRLAHPSTPLLLQVSPIKICIFKIAKGRMVVPVTSHFFDVVRTPGSGAATFTASSNLKIQLTDCKLVDITKSIVDRSNVSVDKICSLVQKFVAGQKLEHRDDFLYMHRYMVESDLPPNMRVPVTNGHPLIEDGLRELRSDPAAVLALFSSCLEAAKLALKFSPRAVIGQTPACMVLYTSALRMYAGSYLPYNETTDDRTLPSLLFHTNHDCDDMALAALSLAHACASISLPKGTLFSAAHVLSTVKPTEYYLAQGVTTKHNGHTWAYLDTSAGRLHLECTQLVSPIATDLDLVCGKGAFMIRPHGDDSLNINGIKNLKTAVYARVCAVYTPKSMRLPMLGGRLSPPYGDLLSGRATLVDVPATPPPDPLIRVLRATPTPQVIEEAISKIPGLYDLVNGKCYVCPDVMPGKKGFKHAAYAAKGGPCRYISPANRLAPAQ